MKSNIKKVIMFSLLIFAICLNANCVLADEDEENISGIKALKIEAVEENGNKSPVELDAKFSSDKYIYECKIEKEIESLEIEPELVSEDWNVEIVGQNFLRDGENIITLIASNEDNTESKTYQIRAMRSDVPRKERENPEKKKKGFKLEKNGIIIICVVSIISCILIILIIRTFIKQERNHRNNIDFNYGGKNE